MDKQLNIEYVDKPWGNYKRYTLNQPSTVKVMEVLPNQKLSLQTHKNRDEFWRILHGGVASVTLGDETLELEPGEEAYIPRGMVHRIGAKNETIYFLEIAFGEFDENDIVRLDDSYGRS